MRKKGYPRVNRYLVFSKADEETVLAEDILTKQEWTVDADTYRFMRRLDGRTSPGTVCPPMPALERKQYIRMLLREGLIDYRGRFHVEGWQLMYAVWIPDRKQSRKPASVFNNLLILLFLPVFAAGILVYMRNYELALQLDLFRSDLVLAGMVLGVLAGLAGHEAGHAAAGIAYGAHVCEMGVMLLLLLMPGAYVIMDDACVKKSSRRIQIYAAGVEVNLLLTGLLLLMASAGVHGALFWMFSQAALINVLLAVGNLSVVLGVDGMKIFSEVMMKSQELPDVVLDNLFTSPALSGKRFRRINGAALRAAAVMILLFQVGLLCAICINIGLIFVLRG